jgi:hypothetical protein
MMSTAEKLKSEAAASYTEDQGPWEVGVVTAHPIKHMWGMIKTVFRTWMYARKTGRNPCKWYGVYVRDTDIVIAHCGVGEDAENRAREFARLRQ